MSQSPSSRERTLESLPPAPSSSPAPRPGALADLIGWVWRPLGIYVASRAMTAVAFAVAAYMSPAYDFRGTFLRWDGEWYIPIARDGYPNRVAPGEGSLVAFFPGSGCPSPFRSASAGMSTIIAGSPTAHELRKKSSYLHSSQSHMGPTPRRLPITSLPMPPVP